MSQVVNNKTAVIQGVIAGVVLLAFTFLRPVLFFLLPLVCLLFIGVFHYSISRNNLIILVIALLPPLILGGLSQEVPRSNFILSIMLIFPVIFLYFGKIGIREKRFDSTCIDYFIKIATLILLVSNIYGFFQLVRRPWDDDSFVGFYGLHGLAMHTLSLVNFIMSVFYYYKYKNFPQRKYLYYSIFFFLSAFSCFFGLGLVAFCFTILLVNFDLNYIRRFINKILIFSLLGLIVLGSVIALKPKILAYNIANIEKATNTIANFESLKIYNEEELERNYETPRKLVLYFYYFKLYFSDASLFLWGYGPGTFNSRTSFLLNGDYSQNKLLEIIFGFTQPDLAAAYVYPLWNSKLISKKFMDGTRNEPFSSIIAVLTEYGFVFFILIGMAAYRSFRSLMAKGNFLLSKEFEFNGKVKHYLSFIRFTGVFILVNLFLDNYLEYPELILVFIVLYKFIELYFNSAIEKLLGESINNS